MLHTSNKIRVINMGHTSGPAGCIGVFFSFECWLAYNSVTIMIQKYVDRIVFVSFSKDMTSACFFQNTRYVSHDSSLGHFLMR